MDVIDRSPRTELFPALPVESGSSPANPPVSPPAAEGPDFFQGLSEATSADGATSPATSAAVAPALTGPPPDRDVTPLATSPALPVPTTSNPGDMLAALEAAGTLLTAALSIAPDVSPAPAVTPAAPVVPMGLLPSLTTGATQQTAVDPVPPEDDPPATPTDAPVSVAAIAAVFQPLAIFQPVPLPQPNTQPEVTAIDTPSELSSSVPAPGSAVGVAVPPVVPAPVVSQPVAVAADSNTSPTINPAETQAAAVATVTRAATTTRPVSSNLRTPDESAEPAQAARVVIASPTLDTRPTPSLQPQATPPVQFASPVASPLPAVPVDTETVNTTPTALPSAPSEPVPTSVTSTPNPIAGRPAAPPPTPTASPVATAAKSPLTAIVSETPTSPVAPTTTVVVPPTDATTTATSATIPAPIIESAVPPVVVTRAVPITARVPTEVTPAVPVSTPPITEPPRAERAPSMAVAFLQALGALDSKSVGRTAAASPQEPPAPMVLDQTVNPAAIAELGLRPQANLGPVAEFPPLPLAEPARLVQQLSEAVLTSAETGQQLSLRVTPEAYGPIVVNVRLEDGQLTARVETHSALAQQVLSENLPQLVEALASRGTTIERLDVVPIESRTPESFRDDRVRETLPEGANGGGGTFAGTPSDSQTPERRREPVLPPSAVQPARDPNLEETPVASRPERLQTLNIRV